MCYCGQSAAFEECCKPIISNQTASSPEQLMRSRYSAFASHSFEYLLDTHHPDTRGALSVNELRDSAKNTEWLSLEILNISQLSALKKPVNQVQIEHSGKVEFVAYYQSERRYYRLHENSYFESIAGKWLYKSGSAGSLSGSFSPGRNDLCPCGSKKKFKKCCYA